MISWMGRYRPLVEALVCLCNQAARSASCKFTVADGIALNSVEWQVLEYLYEHDGDFAPMLHVSESLRIAQSSYSKIIKTLKRYGLVEKYHVADNRKNVIVRVNAHGRKVYDQYSTNVANSSWKLLFDRLNTFSDDDIATFTDALKLLLSGMPDDANVRSNLIAIDQANSSK